MKRFLVLLPILIFVLLGSCNAPANESKAKYVFLFIGDGMGMNQVYATELYLAALKNESGNGALSFSDFPVQSYMTTYATNNLVTCSSAAATAMATGFKTDNGVVNMNAALTEKYETVAEKAKKNGYKVGILSSVAIDHATPACFYAHQHSRNMYYEISMELPESGFDYFGGGAFNYPKGRNDSMPNAFENAVSKGYTLVNTQEAFNELKKGNEKILAINPELYPKGEFFWEIDKVKGAISLAQFTKKGIELLDNDKGFFMMVEGGKIDWACHANDIGSCIHETLAFNDAVAEAIAFYKQHPNETLIIVTADHETGGLTVGINKPMNLGVLQYQDISNQEFVRKLVNLKDINSKASFEDLLKLIELHYGLGNANKGLALTKADLDYLKKGYELEFVENKSDNPDENYLLEGDEVLIADRVLNLMSQKAGIGWISGGHSGTPVPIRAMGQGEQYFSSYIDNTDVSKIISKVMGL